MAYVVRRRHGRFEIRESIHTANGPRARTLVSFTVLTDSVLAAAAARAQRPFDPARVRMSAARQAGRGAGDRREPVRPGRSEPARAPYTRFAEAARRMASSLSPPSAGRRDPGDALIDLLGFAEQVVSAQAARPFEALGFPPLATLADRGPGGAPAPTS